jgi:glycosyltransferase involved in cell wall biosynthesis
VGSPTKIVESLALSRPVVANHHPDQSEVLQQSGGGISVEWAAKDYAKALLSLLNDTERADRMGRSGAQWVAQNRTYSMIAGIVAGSYEKLLKADS